MGFTGLAETPWWVAVEVVEELAIARCREYRGVGVAWWGCEIQVLPFFEDVSAPSDTWTWIDHCFLIWPAGCCVDDTGVHRWSAEVAIDKLHNFIRGLYVLKSDLRCLCGGYLSETKGGKRENRKSQRVSTVEHWRACLACHLWNPECIQTFLESGSRRAVRRKSFPSTRRRARFQ